MRARPTFLLFVLVLLCSRCWAADAFASQRLRVEVEMHTAPIYRASVDASGQLVATASEDETVRLWNPAGRLLRTLRPPLAGRGDEALYAVAVRPDGAAIAVAGTLGREPEGTYSIYLFERATGEISRRIGGLRNAVLDLAWSRDGRYLAAAQCGGHGVAVFRASDFVRLHRVELDRQPAEPAAGATRRTPWCPGPPVGTVGDSMGLDFDDRHRLAVSSFDGRLRLYQVDESSVREAAMPHRFAVDTARGEVPFAVRFSPDGKRLAVGFDRSTRVAVLWADTLRHVESQPSSAGVKGQLASVAWSGDGESLYAGGRHWDDRRTGKFALRRWGARGEGSPIDLPVAADFIQDLRSSAAGIVFVSQRPEWGVLGPGGTLQTYVGPRSLDFWKACDSFELSHDASSFSISTDRASDRRVTFEVAQARIVRREAAGQLFATPAGSPRLRLGRGDEGEVVDVNGSALQLDQGESPVCGVVTHDGQEAYVGTTWNIRVFGPNGGGHPVRTWKTPGWRAFAVAASRDGRLIVGAFADGTVRWYRRSDGAELLALFIAPDERWVMWTPSGYFDASVGAEDLVGWQVGRGVASAPGFYPVARFRAAFRRPDVLRRILSVQDEALALELADRESGERVSGLAADLRSMLPPEVSIVAPEDGARVSTGARVRLRLHIRNPAGGPVDELAIRVNAYRVPFETVGSRALGDSVEEREIELDLSRLGGPELFILIDARSGRRLGTPARLGLMSAEGPAPSASPPAAKPKLVGLVAGVSSYTHESLDPLLGADDAKRVAAAMRRQEGGLYRKVELRVIDELQFDLKSMSAALTWLKEASARDATVVVYLAGHAKSDKDSNYYFLPRDADPQDLAATGIPGALLVSRLREVSGRVLVFLDTCYAGTIGTAITGPWRTRGRLDMTNLLNEMQAVRAGVMVYAASGESLAHEIRDPEGPQGGAFTLALLDALERGTPPGAPGSAVTTAGLQEQIGEVVRRLTLARPGGPQLPVTIVPGSGMPQIPVFLATGR